MTTSLSTGVQGQNISEMLPVVSRPCSSEAEVFCKLFAFHQDIQRLDCVTGFKSISGYIAKPGVLMIDLTGAVMLFQTCSPTRHILIDSIVVTEGYILLWGLSSAFFLPKLELQWLVRAVWLVMLARAIWDFPYKSRGSGLGIAGALGMRVTKSRFLLLLQMKKFWDCVRGGTYWYAFDVRQNDNKRLCYSFKEFCSLSLDEVSCHWWVILCTSLQQL